MTIDLSRLSIWKCGPRVINRLRKAFPGRWSYDPQQHRWLHESGWYVEARSMLAPRYDGDDDSFVSVFYRSDTGERVFI